jgi:RNA-directed DNA polymerase
MPEETRSSYGSAITSWLISNIGKILAGIHEGLRGRLGKFGLRLNEHKTRLIEFGRLAVRECTPRDEAERKTFNYFGFRHFCSESRKDKFSVIWQTFRRCMQSKLMEF